MTRTRIKFCGITRPQDAVDACAAGADAIGINFFARSARCVTIPQAEQIVAAIKPLVTPIALFVDTPTEEIQDTAASLGITCVQLHGDETTDDVAALAPLRVLKAVRMTPGALDAWRNRSIDNLAGLLLETPAIGDDGVPGGTGVENDWNAVAAADLAGLPPLLLAGGLTPQNVGAVIRRLRPYAVDVSSGIEVTKGLKSRQKMLDFAAAVAGADRS